MIPLLGIGDFFTAIMTPLHAAISAVIVYAYKGLSHLTGPNNGITWALAIITLTVIVRTLLIPLFIKQINSARNMQLIQPKMKALQEKYGADRNKLGIETQKLMKEEGVNPMASCFPMLLQMPVFFALYQVLYAASQGTARGYFFEHNPDLVASLNHASLFGGSLSGHFWMTDWSQFGATQIMSLVGILLMTALFFITQKQLMGKNMPPEAQTGQMAQQQKMMLYLFPFMYLFMGLFIPVGVLLYWVTSNLWTLVQQYLLIRNNPTPGTPAYVDWEERMIAKGKDPKEIEAQRRMKRSKAPKQSAPSRPVAGQTPTTATSDIYDMKGTPSSGVVRQQIQRQQPSRKSRSTRATPKKPNE